MKAVPSQSEALLTEKQVAELLNISVRTLQAWRVTGDGPSYVKAGRVIRYRERQVEEWIDQRLHSATSVPCKAGEAA